jgi:hypothetical protein
MFTLTKIYAQANSRNVNIASSGVVKPGNIRVRACLPDSNFTAEQDGFTDMRYQAVIEDGCRMWNMVEQKSTMSRYDAEVDYGYSPEHSLWNECDYGLLSR